MKIGYSAKFLNEVNKADAQVALEIWIKELNSYRATYKVSSKAYVYDDLQSMAYALANREIDFVAITSLDYLRVREKIPIEPLVVANRGKEVGGDRMIILVRRDREITNIQQLRDKKLLVHSGIMLDHANLWLDILLANYNLPKKDNFFGAVKNVPKLSSAVLPVFFRQADAALVIRGSFEMMAALNPQLERDLMVITSSDKILYGMFCFRADLPADAKTEMLKSVLNIQSTPTGKQILTLFQVDSLTEFKPSLMTSTIGLLSRHNNMKKSVLGKN